MKNIIAKTVQLAESSKNRGDYMTANRLFGVIMSLVNWQGIPEGVMFRVESENEELLWRYYQDSSYYYDLLVVVVPSTGDYLNIPLPLLTARSAELMDALRPSLVQRMDHCRQIENDVAPEEEMREIEAIISQSPTDPALWVWISGETFEEDMEFPLISMEEAGACGPYDYLQDWDDVPAYLR